MAGRHGLAALLCAAVLGHCTAALAEEPRATPVCLYDGRSYSPGAYICVQKALMLTCASDGAQLAWKIVPDRDLSDRCLAPASSASAPAAPRHYRRAAVHRRPVARVHPVASPKCFYFNGRQYCE